MGKLVLSRKPGQEVVITGDILVTVVDLRKGHVKLAFEAPQDILILRKEVCSLEDLAKTRKVINED